LRKALADELLFGRLASGGHVFVDLDDKDEILLDIQTEEEIAPATSS
jgi:ATP-dependent Clp protease ATP-binding subunit ClpA